VLHSHWGYCLFLKNFILNVTYRDELLH